MKLGTETGSMTNHLYSRMVVGQPEPRVGMGATLLGWTDRHAATIVDVFVHGHTGLYVTVQEDRAERMDSNGMSESQSYYYARNPNGRVFTFRQTKSGRWQAVEKSATRGRFKKIDGYGLRIGERDKYHDFSF